MRRLRLPSRRLTQELIGRLTGPLSLALLSALLLMAASARAEVGEVRVGVQFGFIYLPLNVMESEGFVAKRAEELGVGPLKVTLRRFSGTPAMNEALISGQLDYGALGPPGSIILAEKTRGRQGFKGLAGLPLTAFYLYTNKPNVKSLKDFDEQQDRIVVTAPNAGQAIIFRIAMDQIYGKGGYRHADQMMTSLPHPDAVGAVLAGTVAGYWATSPYWQGLAKDPRVHVVTTAKDILGFDTSGSELMGSSAFFDANPKVSRAVLMGLEDANRLINDNPRRAAEIYVKAEASNANIDDIAAMLKDGSNTFTVVPGGTMRYAESMAETGMLQAPLKSWKDVFFPLIHDRDGT